MMQKYILLIGVVTDPLLQYVAKSLIKKNLSIAWINLDELGKTIFGCDKGWRCIDLQQNTIWKIKHLEVCGVYSRFIGVDHKLASKAQIVNFDLLLYLLNNIYPNVINRPKHYWSNFSKLGQLLLLSNYSLLTPESYLQVFTGFAQPGFIYKSASSVRSIVKFVESRSICSSEPILIQKGIQGVNIRVHVFKKNCYATQVLSKQVDYRYCEQSVFSKVELPGEIVSECIKITADLQLELSGIDLILTTDNKWYILEVNPSPSFSFFCEKTKDFRLMQDLMQYFNQLTKGGV